MSKELEIVFHIFQLILTIFLRTLRFREKKPFAQVDKSNAGCSDSTDYDSNITCLRGRIDFPSGLTTLF